MQKLTIIKNISLEGSIKEKGDIVIVGNNIAHSLIDKGVAKLFSSSNKMMTTKRKKRRKGYRIK